MMCCVLCFLIHISRFAVLIRLIVIDGSNCIAFLFCDTRKYTKHSNTVRSKMMKICLSKE